MGSSSRPTRSPRGSTSCMGSSSRPTSPPRPPSSSPRSPQQSRLPAPVEASYTPPRTLGCMDSSLSPLRSMGSTSRSPRPPSPTCPSRSPRSPRELPPPPPETGPPAKPDPEQKPEKKNSEYIRKKASKHEPEQAHGVVQQGLQHHQAQSHVHRVISNLLARHNSCFCFSLLVATVSCQKRDTLFI